MYFFQTPWIPELLTGSNDNFVFDEIIKLAFSAVDSAHIGTELGGILAPITRAEAVDELQLCCQKLASPKGSIT